MPAEPTVKRTIAFFDGQNLFYAAKYAFGYPVSPTYSKTRGINKTDWVRIDRALYDACLDLRDYRPKGGRP